MDHPFSGSLVEERLHPDGGDPLYVVEVAGIYDERYAGRFVHTSRGDGTMFIMMRKENDDPDCDRWVCWKV